MTIEQQPEKQPETKVEQKTETKVENVIVDIEGYNIEVPIEIGKKLIEVRQKIKEQKIKRTEEENKKLAEKEALLKAMKDSDIESVKAQVSGEYLDKINKYENKIFKSEIKNLLSSAGVLPEALEDATKLALNGVKVELDGEEIKIDGKNAKESVQEFIKNRPHLLSVSNNNTKKIVVTPINQKPTQDFKKFTQGIFKK